LIGARLVRALLIVFSGTPKADVHTIAAEYCDRVILTNEDPYDEDPEKILEDMARGIDEESKLSIVLDRRRAIREALDSAPDKSIILITGKGTDPYIMGPHNTKTPWSDAKVVQQEMSALFSSDM
jgi:UDP-N-acetylmuramoyl-L-alanyl-D-glutamate--2,6-diaminopimelate ligase